MNMMTIIYMHYFEGSRPEWCISSMIYSRDTLFWSGTLDMIHAGKLDRLYTMNDTELKTIELFIFCLFHIPFLPLIFLYVFIDVFCFVLLSFCVLFSAWIENERYYFVQMVNNAVMAYFLPFYHANLCVILLAETKVQLTLYV